MTPKRSILVAIGRAPIEYGLRPGTVLGVVASPRHSYGQN